MKALLTFAAGVALAGAALAQQAAFGLQAGQFSSEKEAFALADKITAQGMPGRVISARDAAGRDVSVVAAGNFTTQDEARAQRAALAGRLGITGEMAVIALPAPPSPL